MNLRTFLLEKSIWIILIVFLITASIFIPRFFSFAIFNNILKHSVFIGILVIGESLCLLTGNFDLSVAAIMTFTGMFGALLIGQAGAGFGLALYPGVAFLSMLIVGGLIGLFNGFFVTKMKINPFVVTLATLIILGGANVLLTEGRAITLIPSYFRTPAVLDLAGTSIMVWITFGLFVLFHFIISRTKFGRHIYAVGGNPKVSYKFGIDPDKVIMKVYVLSGVLAAIAGALLIGRMNSATPGMGEGMLFEVFAAAVIGGISLQGGRGTLIGALGGVFLLSSITSALNLLGVSPYYLQIVRGSLIFIAVLLDSIKEQYRSA